MNLKAWVISTRPPTLVASIVPILASTAYLINQTNHRSMVFYLYGLLFLVACLSMQIACNFTNDYYDYLRGTDDEDRRGPKRMLQQKVISIQAMGTMIIIVYSIPMLIGFFLSGALYHLDQPFFAGLTFIFTILSVVISFTYTGGKYPLGYHGVGDLAAFIFFGPGLTVMLVLIWGLLQNQLFSPFFNRNLNFHLINALLIGVSMGCFSLTLININNLRDLEQDKKKNKNTLAVYLTRWLGKERVYQIFAGYLFLALLSPLFYPLHRLLGSTHSDYKTLIIYGVGQIFIIGWLGLIAKKIFIQVKENDSNTINLTLKTTGKLYLVSGVVQSIFIGL